MKLHWSPKSPYVRKVMVVAHEHGLQDRIDCVRTPVVSSDPGPELLADNPLHKMPTLVLDDGRSLYDSCVIAEYLDAMGQGPKLFPAQGDARWDALRRQALGNGFMDLLIAWRLESVKPQDQQAKAYLVAYARKTEHVLRVLEAETPAPGAALDIGGVAVGCALGYLDYRFGYLEWSRANPRLKAWLYAFEARPSVLGNPIEKD